MPRGSGDHIPNQQFAQAQAIDLYIGFCICVPACTYIQLIFFGLYTICDDIEMFPICTPNNMSTRGDQVNGAKTAGGAATTTSPCHIFTLWNYSRPVPAPSLCQWRAQCRKDVSLLEKIICLGSIREQREKVPRIERECFISILKISICLIHCIIWDDSKDSCQYANMY